MTMRKFLLLFAVLFALPAHAVPDIIPSQTLDRNMCVDIAMQLHRESGDRRLQRVTRKAFDLEWVSNSKGQMLAFDCTNIYRGFGKYDGTVFIIDLPTLDAEIQKAEAVRLQREAEYKRKIAETNLL